MGKVLDPNVTPDDLEKLKTTINHFSKFQKNLDRKDINQYDSVKDIRQAIEKHENRIRRNIKEIKGADIVYEDDEFTVVTPKTHEIVIMGQVLSGVLQLDQVMPILIDIMMTVNYSIS